MGVLRQTMSFSPYLRSAMVQFPLVGFHLKGSATNRATLASVQSDLLVTSGLSTQHKLLLLIDIVAVQDINVIVYN